MDHLPFILQQTKGAEGFVFHGGATDENGNWDQARRPAYVRQRLLPARGVAPPPSL